ncbi:Emc6p [Sporobolomyces koalae]|uniref:Emc6p n=1 Tax=Sporobolomyces koalae TaxID=500713 RepID=UPI0031775D65
MPAAAPPPPSVLLSSAGQPVYAPNLQHNNKALYYVKSTTACIAGATAGLLGLTNTIGFVFFFVTAFATGLLFALFNCHSQPSKFFLTAREPILGGVLENLFSYVLFWTLFYSLVYIYD